MKVRSTLASAALALALVLALAGCTAATPGAGSPSAGAPETTKTSTPDTTATSGDAAGLRIANGLYDQADGTVIALGTLEWRDLEGGFWAITGAPGATGDADKVIAVIANAAQDDVAYVKLAGTTVQITGTRLEGVSVRNAGPEVTATSITEITDTPGIAE